MQNEETSYNSTVSFEKLFSKVSPHWWFYPSLVTFCKNSIAEIQAILRFKILYIRKFKLLNFNHTVEVIQSIQKKDKIVKPIILKVKQLLLAKYLPFQSHSIKFQTNQTICRVVNAKGIHYYLHEYIITYRQKVFSNTGSRNIDRTHPPIFFMISHEQVGNFCDKASENKAIKFSVTISVICSLR